jgi:predicted dienelactone hydrolase
MRRMVVLAMVVACARPVPASEPPSRYGVDAPELARLGEHAVGFKTLHLVQHGQIDVLAFDAAKGFAPLVDRVLAVELWYPARPAPSGTGYPLVIVPHGYSNDPDAMTWLTENLASKGYVVAAIRHDDPPITDRTLFAQPLMRRPLDIAFVAQSLQSTLGAERLIDPARTALIGYSMGGYGVLTAAGATLDPDGGAVKRVPGGLMRPY